MPYFKINHEHELDWNVDNNDLSTFIIIASEQKTECGFTTCVCTNRKQRAAIVNEFSTIGHSTFNPISQFDVKIKTGITRLKEGMKAIGATALRSFLSVNSHRPLACVNLAEILSTQMREETTASLGPPSPLSF